MKKKINIEWNKIALVFQNSLEAIKSSFKYKGTNIGGDL